MLEHVRREESAAKEKYQMPNSTFGQVVGKILTTGAMNPQIIGVLSALNDLRNKNFGTGFHRSFRLLKDRNEAGERTDDADEDAEERQNDFCDPQSFRFEAAGFFRVQSFPQHCSRLSR
jgi:hypothetical protein